MTHHVDRALRLALPLHDEVRDGARLAADQIHHGIELEADGRMAVDRDDDVAGFESRAIGGRADDRLDDDRALGLLVLADVDPDAAEVAAADQLRERALLARVQEHGVRIAERVEHAGDRGEGQVVGAGLGSVAREGCLEHAVRGILVRLCARARRE